MFVSETYTIEDLCLYVDGSSNAHFPTASSSGGWLTTSTNIEKIPIDSPISLPSAFEISFKGYITATGSWNIIAVGEADNCNTYAGGQFINKGAFIRKGWAGSCNGAYLIQESNCCNLNEETTVVYQYSNGTHKLKIGNNEYTATDTSYTPSKFLGIGNSGTNSKMKEIKIKPL